MTNLAGPINDKLPPELGDLLRQAGDTARGLGYHVYLVGGAVRDLLLGQANLDIDLAVEGDAIALAGKLIEKQPGKLTIHPRFITATIAGNGWSLDLATARSETYAQPGALPSVKPGAIGEDLFRRDFTVNAMAVNLNPDGYGELIDRYDGLEDLNNRQLRILHERSFRDDSTRIWRCLRYSRRLDFAIEPVTLGRLRQDVPMLATVSGDRIRHELELVLAEKEPEKTLVLAGELGVLQQVHPSLRGDDWLVERFRAARESAAPKTPAAGLYLALLVYRLNNDETEKLIEYLNPPKAVTASLRDTMLLKSRLAELEVPSPTPSSLYRVFQGRALSAVTAVRLAGESSDTREYAGLYLDKLRYVKIALTGNDLIELGIPPGPRIKEIQAALRDARLDGRLNSRAEEVELVRKLR